MSKISSPFSKSPITFFYFFLTLIPFHVISQPPASDDRTVLLNLKRQWGNPPWTESWNSSSSPCDWPEVNCTAGAVTRVVLKNLSIIDPIPPSICDLKNLTVLDLALNLIPGNFPTVLYNCSKLQYLDLSENLFVGPLPSDIHRMSSVLQYIDVGGNNFSGDIPAAIGQLPKLQHLKLYSNLFNGTFPDEIGNLSNLVNLSMPFNPDLLPAAIPPEFGKLKKLTHLWMTQTNLIGSIPDNFSDLSSLEYLDLSENSLNGSLPRGLFQLTNLRIVYLYKNQFSGEIPTSVQSRNLIELDLSTNNLTGSIPVDIGNLQKLQVLNMFFNQLSGEVPPSIGLIPTLTQFRVFTNNLNGTLPPEMGLHSKLEAFEVCDNHFTGNLPENLCSGQTLFGVVAFSNNLTGTVPYSLGSCLTLRTVQLYNNNISGEVPLGLWTSFNMYSLMLSNNLLSGTLPTSLAWNLTRVEISNNQFSGQIPTAVSSWVRLVVFKASNNQLSGDIPVELTNLPQLITLNLDGNSLTGNLPSTIVSWKSLTTLNLARNQLTGLIPPVIGSLPDLLDLDLSGNQFSGQIPPQLGNLRLTTLNLSSNQLTGEIPNSFDNLAYDQSFLNNPRLCATAPIANLQSCSSKTRRPNISPAILAVILVFAVLLLLITVSLSIFMVRDYRRKKLKEKLAGWKLTSFQRFEFTKTNILMGLTENNLIGSGGSGKIYRVGVNLSGDDYVAVKSIWNNRKLDHKLEKEFLAEVEILGTIRHSNIVKLLCCISSEESKLLVYEYMENQSLDRWLHGKKWSSTASALNSAVHHTVLDWPRRLDIAIGAAQGLCYMHHDCAPPIIHRDVKSSNILLDSEFKARIADFGLAKILVKQGEPNTMSAVAGSFGYMAPEYAYTTKVNEKIDVYSFGVVLLELTTGREANDGDEHTSLAEWAWRRYGEGSAYTDSLDGDIKEPCYLEEMTTVLKLGLMCTSALPSARPSMKEVAQILRRCYPREGSEEEKTRSQYEVAPLLGSGKYLSCYNNRSRKVVDEEESV